MNDFKKNVMGLAIKRRNYCSFTKELMQSIFDRMMESTTPNPEDIREYVRTKLIDLANNNIPLDDLTVTNTLRDHYKNPEGQAHVQLAKRMRERGETVNMNDRIKYMYAMLEPIYNTKGNPKKRKMVDVVEEYNYAMENNVEYDPEIYIDSQLKEPISQVLEHVMDDYEEIFNEAIELSRNLKINKYGPPKIPTRRKVGG
jgi:DNA polymerase elongation subunit (family B)